MALRMPFRSHLNAGTKHFNLQHVLQVIACLILCTFHVIYQTQETIPPGYPNPRRELKIRRAAEYF